MSQQSSNRTIKKTDSTINNREAVARLNKACGVVECFSDRLDPAELYQTQVTRAINSDLFKTSKDGDYTHPYELIIQDFKAAFGEAIIEIEAVDVMIKLDLGTTCASRRLIVP